jgi:hypothetical protein
MQAAACEWHSWRNKLDFFIARRQREISSII